MSLGEVVVIGRGVRVPHVNIDLLHRLGPRAAQVAVSRGLLGSGMARLRPEESWRIIDEAHRRMRRFRGADGECAHSMFEKQELRRMSRRSFVPCQQSGHGGARGRPAVS